MNSKIGIFGGTFNPVHLGHLHCAQEVVKELSLDQLFLVPAKTPVHKKIKENISTAQRVQMLDLALQSFEKIELSTYEINSTSDSYTIYTVEYFQKKYPESELYLVIGLDSYENFHLWKRYKDILHNVILVVLCRPGYQFQNVEIDKNKNKRIIYLPNLAYTISSTEIRKNVKLANDASSFLSQDVYQFIKDERLYL